MSRILCFSSFVIILCAALQTGEAQDSFNASLIEHPYNWDVQEYALNGHILYVGWWNYIASFDVGTPQKPVFLDTMKWHDYNPVTTGPDYVISMLVKDNYLYVSTGYHGLYRMNLTNPEKPTIDTNFALHNGYLYSWNHYVLHRYDTLSVFDVSKSNGLKLVHRYPMYYGSTTPYARHGLLRIQHDSIYIATHDSSDDRIKIGILDSSGGINFLPRSLAWEFHGLPSFQYLLIYDSLLYKSWNGDTAEVYSISSLYQPRYLSSIYAGWVSVIEQIDNWVYITNGGGQLYVYDMSDPANPTLVAYYKNGFDGGYDHMIVIENCVYISSGTEGLRIISIGPPNAVKGEEAPSSISLSQSYPNPVTAGASAAISYTVERHGYVSLRVYNTLGRRVATLVEGTAEPGAHTARLNTAGLRPGVYFYRLQTNGMQAQRKMVIAR